MTVEIRPCTDIRAYYGPVEASFGAELREDALPRLERTVERDRLLCAMDGEQVVGGAAAFSFRLTVPGGELPAAGVTAVGVLPTHRRRGILTALMERQLRDIRDRGEPVAILWASEGGIYGRFGYGLAALAARFDIERHRTALRRDDPPDGAVRMIERADAEASFPAVYDRVRREVAGFFHRSDAWWAGEVFDDPEHARDGASPLFLARYDAEGSTEGYIIYRVKSEWDHRGPRSELRVRELMATTLRATRELWRFAFSADLVAHITAWPVQVDHPLLLMLAEPRRLGLAVGDGLWVRLIDLPAALAGRSYAGDGSVVFEVTDGMFPENAGRWRLRVDAGTGEAARSDADADILADVTDIAAAYLGGFSFSELARAGRAVECREGALARADSLFATARRPWCPQIF